LAMAITIGLLLIAALASSLIIGLVWRFLGPGDELAFVRTLLQFLVQGLLLLLVFYLVYRYVPRTTVRGGAAWTGALFAVVLFLVVRPVFSFYVTRFADYNLVYGALASLIILVFWAWISSCIFLIGGQLAALVQGLEYEGRTREDVVQSHALRSPVRRIREAFDDRVRNRA
jgi:membrane protein